MPRPWGMPPGPRGPRCPPIQAAQPHGHPAPPLSLQGFLEWSPLFYGFYPPRPHLAVSYLWSVFDVGLLSLGLILHRSVTPTPGPALGSLSLFELKWNCKRLHRC